MKMQKKNGGRKQLTIAELKAASKSIKTEDALAKIVGGTLSNCHTVASLSQFL